MHGRHAVLFFLLICLPSLAFAEYEIPDHRWTIGYESYGVTLRRFLGDDWEIFLGGGPDDYRGSTDLEEMQYTASDTLDPYRSDRNSHKSESGFVRIGTGRRLLTEERFWLAMTLDVKYGWDNFQNRTEYHYFDSGRYSVADEIGHQMTTRVSLGLRPAYDITSRVVLRMEFGFYYQHTTRTTDSHTTGQDHDGDWYLNTDRRSQKSDSVGVFGYNSLSSIQLLFRF